MFTVIPRYHIRNVLYTMDRLQIRSEVRDILQETVKLIIQEIKEVAETESVKPNHKRKWVKDKVKQDINSYLLPELSKGPTEHFTALNMTEESFNWLLKEVEPYIQKADTVMRMALPASLKLEIILHLFAMGTSLRGLELLFNVSKTSISLMIHNVCDAIGLALKDYIQVPTHEEWKAVENSFSNTWNFPNCCGAIDGKYVVMRSQNDTDHQKIAFVAVCDDDYCFKYIYVWSKKNMSEDVLENSNLFQALENDLFPPDHFIVGNENFPLKKYLMKPYEGDKLSEKEKLFNHRLSHARSTIIDNAFGLLVSRFRIFEKPLPFTADKIEKIVKTCCALHNWLRMTKSPIQVTTLNFGDSNTGNIIDNSWRELLTEGLAERSINLKGCLTEDALQIRDDYAVYYMGEGAVSLQLKNIG